MSTFILSKVSGCWLGLFQLQQLGEIRRCVQCSSDWDQQWKV